MPRQLHGTALLLACLGTGCAIRIPDAEWARQLAVESKELHRRLGEAERGRLEAETNAELDRTVARERIATLEAENARLERLAAGRKGLACLLRWVRPVQLQQRERWECAQELFELDLGAEEPFVRREVVRLFRSLEEAGFEQRGSCSSLGLLIREANLSLRALADAVKAGDRRAAEAAFAETQEVEREMRAEEREVFQRNADALIARARAVLERLPARGEE